MKKYFNTKEKAKSYVGSRFYDYKEPYFSSSKSLNKDIKDVGLYNSFQ